MHINTTIDDELIHQARQLSGWQTTTDLIEQALRAWIELKTTLPHTIDSTAQFTASSPPYHDLDFLAGTWTEPDSREFFANLADLSQIDEELWR